MKVELLASLVSASLAVASIDSVGILLRHGARTHLENWAEVDDFKFEDIPGALTPAGYAQGIQTGSRYFYKYQNLFKGRLFLKSPHLKAITSSVARSHETAVAFMEGWNTVATHDEGVFNGESHFSNGSFAPVVDRNSALFKFVEDRSDLLREGSQRVVRAAHQAQETSWVKDYTTRHAAAMSKLAAFGNFESSAKCAAAKAKHGKESCSLEDFGIYTAGDLISTLNVLSYHSAVSSGMEGSLRTANPELLAFASKALRDDLAGWYIGRSSHIVFANIMDDLLKKTQGHEATDRTEDDRTPLMSLMTSHDSIITGFLMGWGVPVQRLPRIFFADSVAVEVKLPSKDQPTGCVRLLYNGLSAVQTGWFSPCPRKPSLPGGGWVMLDQVEQFVKNIVNGSEADDDAINADLLLAYAEDGKETRADFEDGARFRPEEEVPEEQLAELRV